MSQKTLFQFVVDYLRKQKAYGKVAVRRTSIYDVSEYQFGIEAIANGRALTRGLMHDAATAVGGIYYPGRNGNSKIVF